MSDEKKKDYSPSKEIKDLQESWDVICNAILDAQALSCTPKQLAAHATTELAKFLAEGWKDCQKDLDACIEALGALKLLQDRMPTCFCMAGRDIAREALDNLPAHLKERVK